VVLRKFVLEEDMTNEIDVLEPPLATLAVPNDPARVHVQVAD
jgi:hypothetical protein